MTNGGTTGETAIRADGGRTSKVVSTEPVREGPATDRMAPGSRIRTPVVRVAWVARVAPANSTRRRAVPPAPEAPAGRAVSAVPLAPGGPGDPGMGNGPGMPTGPYGEQPQGQPEQGKKKSPLMPILIIAAVVVLALGGVGVATFFGSDDGTVTVGQSSDDTGGADGSGSGSDSDGGSGGDSGSGSGSDSGSSSDRDSGSGRSGSGSDQVPAVGDCVVRLAEAGERIDPLDFPVVVDCDDPNAVFEILPVRRDSSGHRCVDVPGATDALSYSHGPVEAFFLAKVGDDKSRNINGIKVGECAEPAGDVMYRTECGAPGSYRVVATYDDPGPMQTEYEGAITPRVDAGASEATLVFQWGVADTYDSVEEYQRGICLVEAG